MTFRVGQKVVCVDDRPDWHSRTKFFERGHIYTISDLKMNSQFITGPRSYGAGSGIRFVEVAEPHEYAWFDARRFRPAVERKTDISIFTAMLNPSEKRVDA